MFYTLSPYNVLNGLGLIAGLFLLDQALERRTSDSRDRAYVLFVLCSATGWLAAHMFDALVTRQPLGYAGFTYYGGFLGGGSAFLLLSLRWLSPDQLLRSLNCAVVPLLVAHGIGRVGCFFAGCCYGRLLGVHFRHPTQLYEAAFLLVLAAVVACIQRRHFMSGLRLYLFAYPTFRFFIEFLRADERGSFYGLSTSQWVSFGLLILASVWTYVSREATSASASRAIQPPSTCLGEGQRCPACPITGGS
ncbi:MAG: prolipoprotein diacylglyceryl transferase [Acidobacteriia bacterium]|nr:prolipoprotein diacylglyceryl transferase [Terriglobia bacterium]